MNITWEDVPTAVEQLYVKYADDAYEIARTAKPSAAWILPTEEVGPVIIKQAAPLSWLGKADDAVGKVFGGPNPATSMLVGGALGAGLGYGGGWLAKRIFPRKFRDDLENVTMPIGAMLGMLPAGLRHAMPNMTAWGPQGLFIPSPTQDGPAYPETTALAKASSAYGIKFAADDDDTPEEDRQAMRASSYMGGLYVPDVNVDQWRRDVMESSNLLPQTKAVVAGLPMAAAASTGSRWVSPSDVARVAANMGLGYAVGRSIGMIAGPFLRLTDSAKKDIERAGMLAGVFKTLGLMG